MITARWFWRFARRGVVATVLACTVAACGSSISGVPSNASPVPTTMSVPAASSVPASSSVPAASSARGSPSARAQPAAGLSTGAGNVGVLYAGSLVNLMERGIGPAFDSATNFTFQGYPGGSSSLAQQIRGKVRRGDVFLSASPSADQSLEGSTNGSWVSWYATFATSPLLLAYNPRSRFAARLTSRPWWQVVTLPGFLLGRTDPKLDPKGVLTVQALDQAAQAHHDPGLAKLATSTTNVFPEEDLVGRLEAGQLDAGFFYSVEAAAARPELPTISLAPIALGATYTITVLRGAPNPAGAAAFVRFLLSPKQATALATAGLHPTVPALVGSSADVPAALQGLLAPSP